MKKYYIIALLLLLISLFYFSYTGFSPVISKNIDYKKEVKEIIIANPSNINEVALEYIDFKYKDLDLTEEELSVVKKYQQPTQILKYGNSEKHMYNETYTYDGQEFQIGLGKLNYEAINKIFDINIVEVNSSDKNSEELVSSGEADFVSGVLHSDELAKKGVLIPMGISSQALYYYSRENKNMDKYEDWDGLTIGVICSKFYFPKEKVEEFEKLGINVTIKEYDCYNQVVEALLNDEIDGIIEVFSSHALKFGYKAVEITKYYPENIESIYYSSNNKDIDVLMSAIQKMYIYEGKMQLAIDEFIRMYTYMQFSMGKCFIDEELEFIQSTEDEPLNLFIPLTYPPHSSYNKETKEFSGAMYEVWDEIAKISNIKYKAVIPEEVVVTDIVNDLGADGNVQIDGVVAIKNTDARSKYLIFTRPIYKDTVCIVGNIDSPTIGSPYDLINKRVGIVGNEYEMHTIETYLPNKKFNKYSNVSTKMQGYDNQEVDYMIMTLSEYKNYYFNEYYYDLEIKYRLNEETLVSTAFSQTQRGKMAAQIYEKVISIIDKQEIVDKYYNINIDMQQVIDNERMIISHAFLFSVVVILFFLIRLYVAYQKMEETKQRMKRLAFTDTITGLKNSIAFYDYKDLRGIVIYININKFKKVNDTYGHDVGNKCLKVIAERIKTYNTIKIRHQECTSNECLNQKNMSIYRYANNTFIVAINNCISVNCGEKIANDLTQIISETITIEEKDLTLHLTCSIGIAPKEEEDTCDDVIRKVNMALYMAKMDIYSNIVVASEEVFSQYKRKQIIEEELTKQTIVNNIIPYYQPKVEIETGKVIGIEALARWNQKEDVTLLPEEFIPILEDNRQIDILDISILEKCIIDYMMFKEKNLVADDFRISFNFSVITLEKRDVVMILEGFHQKYHIPYSALELEITETVIVDDIKSIKDKLIRISELGIKIVLDDFSAGNATISKIMDLPINTIKTDKSLIEGRVNSKKEEVFKMMSMLSKNLGLDLIVEGAEKKSQIDFLKRTGVKFVQGFFYSRPLDKDEIQKILLKGHILKSR